MLNYDPLTQQQYVDLLVSFISSQEGHAATRYQNRDDHTTIGYGYTFYRDNNLALWQAAGIALTPAEVALLQSVDAASASQKDSLALQFTRNISQTEAIALLRQTYPEYEGPANVLLAMPFSEERIAFVSLTYNRGVLAVTTKMQAFFTAIENQDRAEAWYQIRYNSNARQYDADLTAMANGITNRRIAESNLFSLYDNPGQGMGEAEAKEVLRMYTTHRAEIDTYESKFSALFAQGGTTIQFQLIVATTKLISLHAAGHTIDGEVLVGKDTGDVIDEYGSLDLSQNDLIFAEGGNDFVYGHGGTDVLYGGAGADRLYGDAGNDSLFGGDEDDTLRGGAGIDRLEGGEGFDTYSYSSLTDGNDTIMDSDGTSAVMFDAKLLSGGFRTATLKKVSPQALDYSRSIQPS